MKKLLPLLFLFLLLLVTPIAFAQYYGNYFGNYNKYSYNYGSSYTAYNPYQYSNALNSRYLINRNFENVTLPQCYDPTIRTTIPMSNVAGFTYCVDSYWYRSENKVDPIIGLIKNVIDHSRFRGGSLSTRYGY